MKLHYWILASVPILVLFFSGIRFNTSISEEEAAKVAAWTYLQTSRAEISGIRNAFIQTEANNAALRTSKSIQATDCKVESDRISSCLLKGRHYDLKGFYKEFSLRAHFETKSIGVWTMVSDNQLSQKARP